MLQDFLIKSAFFKYEIIWKMAMPFLRFNSRLADGFDQRVLENVKKKKKKYWNKKKRCAGNSVKFGWLDRTVTNDHCAGTPAGA